MNNDIDKLFSDLLKNNVESHLSNQKLADNVMESIHQHNNGNVRLKNLWRRIKTIISTVGALLVLIILSLGIHGNSPSQNNLTNYYYLICLLSVGLFYVLITFYWSIQSRELR